MFCTGAVETVKSCIDLSLLLTSLYFQVISFFGKSAPPSSATHFKISIN